LLASYSVDLVALVAALLALGGLDDERGSGSKVDLANAIDALRHRVRVVLQSGRLAAPARTPKILAILDHFIREVDQDETEGSWHPKASLIRLNADVGDDSQWRLWLGSRNLTRDISWDVGLVLVGHERGDGKQIPGIAELGRELAERARLPIAPKSRVFAELRNMRWQMPRGCTVEEVRLLLGKGRSLPEQPSGVRNLTVVSPFLDGTLVSQLGRWGDSNTRRVLVSTQSALSKLASQTGRPLERFSELLYLESPNLEVEGSPLPDGGSRSPSDDEELEGRGLHAKLILAEHARGRSLWLGSSNATQRGWSGPNTEVVARLSVTREIAAGLEAFVKEIGRRVGLETLPAFQEDELEERLETARRQVTARWRVLLRIGDEKPVLEAKAYPHPDDVEFELSVGLLGQPLATWPRGTRSLTLSPVSAGEVTELVRCKLSRGESALEWVQRTPMEPPLHEDRDRRALARYLDPRTFLQWIRALLTGDPLADGGGDWDAPKPRTGTAARGALLTWWAPTLEDVLKAWSRDPQALADIDRKVRAYLHVMKEERQDGDEPQDKQTLEEFSQIWEMLRRELVTGRA
jgi:hypothetical protein